MWTDDVERFASAARESFVFLERERGYSEPTVEYARDYFLVYDCVAEASRIAVGWERSWFVPFIRINDVSLREAFEELGITVDASRFPTCERLARKRLPGIRELFIHWRKKALLAMECPSYLAAYASALRENYESVLPAGRR